MRRRGKRRKEVKQRKGREDEYPTVETAEKLNPADGTVVLSMLFGNPMKRISAKGSADLSSSPMASAEEMCPAVPPADMTTRKAEMSSFFTAWLMGRSTERQQTVEERVSRVGVGRSLLGG